MRQRNVSGCYNGVRSTDRELDVLHPLVSRADEPPTQGQFELAETLGIDISDKNPSSASHALRKALQNLATKLVAQNKITTGMGCVFEGKTPAVVKKVGSAPVQYEAKGAIALITFQVSGKNVGRWVHPRHLSDYRLEKKEPEKKD